MILGTILLKLITVFVKEVLIMNRKEFENLLLSENVVKTFLEMPGTAKEI